MRSPIFSVAPRKTKPLIPIPAATVMLFYQAAAPTGWTRVTDAAIDKHAMRVVTSTAMAVGTQGGANDFDTALNGSVASGNHAGTTPQHTHTMLSTTDGNAGSSNIAIESGTGTADSFPTGNMTSGADGMHSHTIDVDIAYVNILLASKD